MDPDLQDPYVFEPPGSGSVIIFYGSGSGSFHQQAKKVRKTLIFTILRLLFDFLSMKTDVNVPSKSKKQKNLFFVGILSATDEKKVSTLVHLYNVCRLMFVFESTMKSHFEQHLAPVMEILNMKC